MKPAYADASAVINHEKTVQLPFPSFTILKNLSY